MTERKFDPRHIHKFNDPNMINLHHELEQAQSLLAETWRLLKPDAKVMIVDWKPEDTPEGPPLSIRVAPAVLIEQLRRAGFDHITEADRLPYHHILIGQKV